MYIQQKKNMAVSCVVFGTIIWSQARAAADQREKFTQFEDFDRELLRQENDAGYRTYYDFFNKSGKTFRSTSTSGTASPRDVPDDRLDVASVGKSICVTTALWLFSDISSTDLGIGPGTLVSSLQYLRNGVAETVQETFNVSGQERATVEA